MKTAVFLLSLGVALAAVEGFPSEKPAANESLAERDFEMDDNPMKEMDDNPKKEMDDNPKKEMDDYPKKEMDDYPRKEMYDYPHKGDG